MSDTVQDEKQIRDEAAGWYARLNNTTISTDTLRAFRDWRKDDRHAAAYADIEAFWTRAGKLRNDEDIQRAAEEALARKKAPRRGPLTGRGRGALAVLVGLIAFGAVLGLAWPLLGTKTYETGIGEQRVVRLEDGSRVRLDTQSQVRVRYRGASRQLTLLKGRAYFEVARNLGRPFRVKSGDTEVEALGTAFDVRLQPQGVTVTLAEGVVWVDADQGAWVLTPGQQIHLDDQPGEPQVRQVDVAAAISWTRERLVFRDTALETALDEINRYSPTQIVVADPDLAKAPISGVFDTGDTAAFVAAVSRLFDLEVAARNDQEIVLRPTT